MKKDTHPEYHSQAKVSCACGNVFYVGSTKKEMAVEICYACHPFFTGNEKLIDTAGRVEKFKAKRAAAKTETKNKATKKAEKKEKKTTKKAK